MDGHWEQYQTKPRIKHYQNVGVIAVYVLIIHSLLPLYPYPLIYHDTYFACSIWARLTEVSFIGFSTIQASAAFREFLLTRMRDYS